MARTRTAVCEISTQSYDGCIFYGPLAPSCANWLLRVLHGLTWETGKGREEAAGTRPGYSSSGSTVSSLALRKTDNTSGSNTVAAYISDRVGR